MPVLGIRRKLGCLEEKERWIRAKYDAKDFLPPLTYPDVTLVQVGVAWLTVRW